MQMNLNDSRRRWFNLLIHFGLVSGLFQHRVTSAEVDPSVRNPVAGDGSANPELEMWMTSPLSFPEDVNAEMVNL